MLFVCWRKTLLFRWSWLRKVWNLLAGALLVIALVFSLFALLVICSSSSPSGVFFSVFSLLTPYLWTVEILKLGVSLLSEGDGFHVDLLLVSNWWAGALSASNYQMALTCVVVEGRMLICGTNSTVVIRSDVPDGQYHRWTPSVWSELAAAHAYCVSFP